MINFRRSLIAATALMTLTLLSSSTVVLAADSKDAKADSSTNISQAVSQSYTAGKGVQIGMIVKADSSKAGVVLPVEQSAIQSMLGVVIAANDSTATLSPEASTMQQVYVAGTGRYSTLVSNQNGPIKSGDLITISALGGIGMKADTGQSIILGRAAGNFTGSANVEGTASLKDSTGASKQVSIGRIPVTIGITKNPLAGGASSNYVPEVLAKAAQSIGGKPVSAARIYIGFVVLLATTIVTGTMLFSGVRSGMIAIGRNPLSRKSIIKSLIQTVLAGLIIFIVGILAVYLLLKL